MSIARPEDVQSDESPFPTPARRSRGVLKYSMHLLRRVHLYLGLFLLPWAILYGITGYLFNHPGAFPDREVAKFGASELAGTPLENQPSPIETAKEVVAALKARAISPVNYELVNAEKAKYIRAATFAQIKTEDQTVFVLFDLANGTGSVQANPLPPKRPQVKAPFAIAPKPGAQPAGGGARPIPTTKPGSPRPPGGLNLEVSLTNRITDSVPTILERTGYPNGEITNIAVPELTFFMSDGEKTWEVTYDEQTGSVRGRPEEYVPPAQELSTRAFLTRLHLAHGYPSTPNAKWYWAVLVDVMSWVLVFWGVSGIFMWWQIKATRWLGFWLMLVGIGAAIALGMGMHEVLMAK